MIKFNCTSAVKNASRKLQRPFTDVDTFDAVIRSIIRNNPFGCISYMNAGTNHPPVEKIKESYTAKFTYCDFGGKQRGTTTECYDTLEGYRAGLAAVPLHAANIAAHGGMVVHDGDADTFAVSLKCHNPSGDLYYLNFSRRQVTITSYRDDGILSAVEVWAEGVPEFA
jgi:hypothetical protein